MKDRKPLCYGIPRPLVRALRIALHGSAFSCLLATPALAELPIAAANWAHSGSFAGGAPVISGSTMTITQTSERGILNWDSFNVGRDNTVNFVQPGPTSSTLNRVLGAGSDPSRILGRIEATGQVMIINRNGVVFGKDSQVNVGGLVASTLDISDDVFNNIGLFGALQEGVAAFEGNPAPADSAVRVEEGARLVATGKENGRILLIAPTVENRGTIETPDGQAMLIGAKDKVYFAQLDDNSTALLVEVGSGGDVTNVGRIIAERGEVTLAGLAVNQQGTVRASTAINVNGSIHLVARDGATIQSTGTVNRAVASRSGTVTLGENSVTEVVLDTTRLKTGRPEDGVETAIDGQKHYRSKIALEGRHITLKSGSTLRARNGDVTLEAYADPAQRFADTEKNDSSIRVERGAVIDVSGADTAVVPMEANMLTVSLRGNQLADAPLQKNGPLRGRKVRIDRRKGTPLANIDVELAGVERSLTERAASGGTVTLASEGDLSVETGATVDISGGQVRYEGGIIDTSWLITRDGLVNITEARPDIEYLGVFGQFEVKHDKWGRTDIFNTFGGRVLGSFESGYIEGYDAGELVLKAPGITFDGQLKARVIAGRNQRRLPQSPDGLTRPWDQLPLGGRLVVGDEKAFRNGNQNLFGVADVTIGEPTSTTAGETFNISADFLRDSGVNRLAVFTNGSITYAREADITLAAGADVQFGSGAIRFDGTLRSAGGTISMDARDTRGTVLSGVEPVLSFGENALLDVSGQWVNDNVDVAGGSVTSPLAIDAGSVALRARGDLLLAEGSRIQANAGAWLPATSADIRTGQAGDIAIANTDSIGVGRLELGASVEAYGFDTGGSLSITAAGFRIGAPAQPGEIHIDPVFFQQGGFSRYALTATTHGIHIEPGVRIAPRQDNRVLRADNLSASPSGTAMADLVTVERLPDLLRAPTDLSLTLKRNNLLASDPRVELGAGAVIDADPGANISLASDGDLWVFGRIDAPAGNIDLELLASDLQRAFDPAQVLWLGADSRLTAGAVARVQNNELGQPVGEVLDGGTVTVNAQRGFLVTEQGSRIDVSGTSALLSLPSGSSDDAAIDNRLRRVAGAAGRIELTAADGMILDGDLRGRAAGDVAGAAGGALRVAIDTSKRGGANDTSNPGLRFPIGARVLELEQTFVPRLDGRKPGDALLGADEVAKLGSAVDAAGVEAVARISVEQIEAGGFDSLELAVRPESTNNEGGGQQIRLGDGVDLKMKRALRIETPVLAAQASANAVLEAPYLAIGPFAGGYGFHPNNTPVAGTGSLQVSGDLIDLGGDVALAGFASARFDSRGDIRLRGVRAPVTSSFDVTGSLRTRGDLTLAAAQLYPTTLTDYVIEADGESSRVRFEQNGSVSSPLSAGGRLAVRAPVIEQAGTLRAPFGDIRLTAGERLTLDSGSETSVSGAGQLIPYGQTELNGKDWVLDFNQLTRVLSVETDDPGSEADGRPPAKRVSLQAPSIEVAPGARMDVSGGGDLLAWEFQPGPGGTRDILANANEDTGGAFAILPALGSEFAPVDPFATPGFGYEAGETITLRGGPGLPNGEFAVLPARYALLPGAWLVTPQAGVRDPLPGQALARSDRIALVAGKRGAAGTDILESRWSGYAVESGSQWRQRAAYIESRASTFFADQARALELFPGELPQDAGSVQFIAGNRLRLQGELTGAAPSGRSARVDVAATRLAVVDTLTGRTDRVEILSSDLEGFGAESLLLGGRRRDVARGQAIDVSADQVEVENGVSFEAPELVLVARDRVTVADDAQLSGRGASVRGADTLVLEGDGALLRVSTGEQVNVDRNGGSGTRGILSASASSRLFAQRSMTLESSADSQVQGTLSVAPGGSLNLGARRISLGDIADVSEGLTLSNEALSALQVSELILTSRSTLDLIGDVQFGASADGVPLLDRLVIRSAGIAGYESSGESKFVAAEITLANPNDETFVTASRADGTFRVAGTGRLTLEAGGDGHASLALGDGRFDIRGYTQTHLASAGNLIATGDAWLDVAGDLTLEAARITGAAGIDARIHADGRLETLAASTPLPAVQALGARLSLEATEILHRGLIELPGGVLSMTANTSDVRFAAGAVADLSGRGLNFSGRTLFGDAGRLVLRSEAGGIFIDEGSRIDLSAAAGGGDAGELALFATNGVAELRGDLSASHGDGFDGGRFDLDVDTVGDVQGLNDQLDAAGFDRSRRMRIRHGDVTIAAGDTVRAREFALRTDAGAIEVAGNIDAHGDAGGRVVLDAGTDLTLVEGAIIDASARTAGSEGGDVVLRSRDGRMALRAGAGIDVSGRDSDGNADDSGSVRLIAGRRGTGIAMDAVDAEIRGAEWIQVEANAVTEAGRVDSALIGRLQRETDAYMSANTVAADLGFGTDTRFRVLPSLEVVSTGSLDLNSPWLLTGGPSGWIFNGEAGVLTLRAAADLNINADLDGLFTEPDAFGLEQLMGTGPMWSLQLDAGHDLNLAAGRRVRTGTGFVEASAGHDINFGSGASLYSAGENAGGGTLNANVDLLLLPGAITDNGGDVTLSAGGSINALPSSQLPSDWQPRLGGTIPAGSVTGEVPTAWSVLFDDFRQHVGALGGGTVDITAGASINNLSVALATSGQQTGIGSVDEPGPFQFVSSVESNEVAVLGGGRLSVRAGADIAGGFYHVGAGEARLRAGGEIRAGDNGLAPVLSLGDTRFDVWARGGMKLETALNPTLIDQTLVDPFFGSPLPKSLFATYDTDPLRESGLTLGALSGDLVLSNDVVRVAEFFGTDDKVVTLYPGSLNAQALQGDVVIERSFTLFPSAQGDLQLFAAGNVTTGSLIQGVSVNQSDADVGLLPNVQRPVAVLDDNFERRLDPTIVESHAATPVHVADDVPAVIVARDGDIAPERGTGQRLSLFFAEPVQLSAGRDLRNLEVVVQHNSAGATSLLQAGRDIVMPTRRSKVTGLLARSDTRLQVAGPGRMDLQAGRDIDLGSSKGLLSVGNEENGFLPDGGAALTLMAGLSPDTGYDQFIDQMAAAPALDASSGQAHALAVFRKDVIAFVRDSLGEPELDAEAALAAFRRMDRVTQNAVLFSALFEQVRDAGVAAADGGSFQPGYDAIAALFPDDDARQGDIRMLLSQVTTLDGGDINLLAPYGGANAGVANIEQFDDVSADELGVLAQREGSVSALVRDDFLVNATRVFAQDGGDILIWASRGDIDAGSGANLSGSVPERKVEFDKFGNVSVRFPPAVASAGIRNFVRTPGRKSGDAFLFAPQGKINAGDAGISSAGNLTLAATQVLGADNIEVGGTSVGVPGGNSAPPPGLAGASALSAGVTKNAEASTTARSDGDGSSEDVALMSVEVLGFGETGSDDGADRKDKRKPVNE